MNVNEVDPGCSPILTLNRAVVTFGSGLPMRGREHDGFCPFRLAFRLSPGSAQGRLRLLPAVLSLEAGSGIECNDHRDMRWGMGRWLLKSVPRLFTSKIMRNTG